MTATIRSALTGDVPSIAAIYNEAVRTSVATFDTEPKTPAEFDAWFRDHGSRHPVLVTEEDGSVVAWASLSAWSDRCAYDDTAEVSIYVRSDRRGKGLGAELLRALVRAGSDANLFTLIARVSDHNEASLRLHRTAGFREIGEMKQVGFKFGRRLDVQLLQLMLRPAPGDAAGASGTRSR